MKPKIFLAALLLAASIAFAQEHPTIAAQANTVYVGADGKFESAPDTAVIQFNVSVQEDTSQAAYQHASRDVEQLRQVMRANSIDPKSANLGFESVQPVYDPKSPKQKVISYRVTTNVTLKLKDFSKIGALRSEEHTA